MTLGSLFLIKSAKNVRFSLVSGELTSASGCLLSLRMTRSIVCAICAIASEQVLRTIPKIEHNICTPLWNRQTLDTALLCPHSPSNNTHSRRVKNSDKLFKSCTMSRKEVDASPSLSSFLRGELPGFFIMVLYHHIYHSYSHCISQFLPSTQDAFYNELLIISYFILFNY